MRRSKAIAIRQNAFSAALYSAQNAAKFLVDFMYGTPERVRITMAFALALALMGGVMFSEHALAVCAI